MIQLRVFIIFSTCVESDQTITQLVVPTHAFESKFNTHIWKNISWMLLAFCSFDHVWNPINQISCLFLWILSAVVNLIVKDVFEQSWRGWPNKVCKFAVASNTNHPWTYEIVQCLTFELPNQLSKNAVGIFVRISMNSWEISTKRNIWFWLTLSLTALCWNQFVGPRLEILRGSPWKRGGDIDVRTHLRTCTKLILRSSTITWSAAYVFNSFSKLLAMVVLRGRAFCPPLACASQVGFAS